MKLEKFIGKQYGDFLVLEVLEKGVNYHTSKFKVKCLICGALLERNGQCLYKNPIHNRFCYQGLYNEIPWKENYSRRYANILKRCKSSPYYKNINCNLKFYEFMEEMLYLQKDGNLSDEEMLKLTIDRIDNNKGYEKGNLRMATRLTQVYNRRVKINCFIATKDEKSILCNSSKMFANYIGSLVSGVNNAVRRNSIVFGWKINKISEYEFNNLKEKDIWAKVIFKNYV